MGNSLMTDWYEVNVQFVSFPSDFLFCAEKFFIFIFIFSFLSWKETFSSYLLSYHIYIFRPLLFSYPQLSYLLSRRWWDGRSSYCNPTFLISTFLPVRIQVVLCLLFPITSIHSSQPPTYILLALVAVSLKMLWVGFSPWLLSCIYLGLFLFWPSKLHP